MTFFHGIPQWFVAYHAVQHPPFGLMLSLSVEILCLNILKKVTIYYVKRSVSQKSPHASMEESAFSGKRHGSVFIAQAKSEQHQTQDCYEKIIYSYGKMRFCTVLL